MATEKLDVSMVSLRAILHAVAPRLQHGTPVDAGMSTPEIQEMRVSRTVKHQKAVFTAIKPEQPQHTAGAIPEVGLNEHAGTSLRDATPPIVDAICKDHHPLDQRQSRSNDSVYGIPDPSVAVITAVSLLI